MGRRSRDDELDDFLEEVPESGDPENDRTVPFDDALLDDLDDLMGAAQLDEEELDPRRDRRAAPIDDVPTDLDDLDELLPDVTSAIPTSHPATWDLPVLPWSTTARIAEYDLELPALCDPTRPRTEWITPRPPVHGKVGATIRVGPLSVRVELIVTVGPEPLLRIGRDVLGGRALVSAVG